MATTISATLAAGSVTSPYYYDVVLTTGLCRKTCANKSPTFVPAFSLVSYKQIAAGDYEAVINVNGSLVFTPCGSCDCGAKAQVINQNFVIPFYSESEPTSVSVTGSLISTSVLTKGCSSCGNTVVSDCALNLTVTPGT